MQNNTLDLVAKLLANENINVVRAPVATAAFDIVGRTLILPQWKELTPSIDQMLVAHEVAHALFTTSEYQRALETRLTFNRAKAFLNILEDVRIEKLMKRRYPGLRKVFHAGYVELNDMDFFEVKGRDLQSAHLMDRINLYFKVGYGVVSFSAEEKQFVNRADALETIEETVQLAEDIHNFLKEKEAEALAQAAKPQPIPDDGDPNDEEMVESETEDAGEQPGDDVDSDNDTSHSFRDLADGEQGESESASQQESVADQSSDSDQEGTKRPGTASSASSEREETDPAEGEDDDGPTTNRAFESRVEEMADTSTEYQYWKLASVKYNPIVSYAEINKRINNKFNAPASSYMINQVREFKRDTQNNVDYLVKEFEMRKAATAYKRAQVSKTGSLDARRLWAYKLNDDIFKRVTTVKQGKNHGMVFLLDWSGSMSQVIQNTIDQVINLAAFCQRAGIVFQVFAFTDDCVSDEGMKYLIDNISTRPAPNEIDVSSRKFALLELFSNKMSASEFDTMVVNLKARRVEGAFHLSGTPLNESLVFMYDYIDTFRKANNVEKVSFITLTDGQGCTLPVAAGHTRYDRTGKTVRVRHFLQDRHTKQNHELTYEPSDQTALLIKMIKTRYQCTVLGFYITETRRVDIAEVMRAHYSKITAEEISDGVERVKSDFRVNGYSSLSGTGHDELFVVPTTNTKVQYEQLHVDADASVRSIAANFSKYMNTKKTSRYLLNKFIGHVS